MKTLTQMNARIHNLVKLSFETISLTNFTCKKLLALTFMLVTIGINQAWAAKITTVSGITSGKQYYIGATTSSTDYYLSVASDVATSVAGTAVASGGTVFTFTRSGSAWTIQFTNGNYLSLSSSKANGKVKVQTASATFTITNQSGALRLTIGSYSVQKNNSGTQFGSYANTQTDVWLEEVSGGCTAPETALSITSASSVALNGTLSLISAGGNGGTVTWSVTAGTGSASISGTTLTPSSVGTVTVTAHQDANSYCEQNVNQTVTISAALRTVTWMVEGETHTTGNPTTEVASGGTITALPSDITSSTTASCGGTFFGWALSGDGVVGKTSSDGYKTTPTVYTTAASIPAITENTILYAVFRQEE